MKGDNKKLQVIDDTSIDFGTDHYFVRSDWHNAKPAADKECYELCQIDRNQILKELDEANAYITEDVFEDTIMETNVIDGEELYRFSAGGKISWKIVEQTKLSSELLDNFDEQDHDELNISLNEIDFLSFNKD